MGSFLPLQRRHLIGRESCRKSWRSTTWWRTTAVKAATQTGTRRLKRCLRPTVRRRCEPNLLIGSSAGKTTLFSAALHVFQFNSVWNPDSLWLFRSSLLVLSQEATQFRFVVWCCRLMSDLSLWEFLQLPPESYSAIIHRSAAVGLGEDWDATISAWYLGKHTDSHRFYYLGSVFIFSPAAYLCCHDVYIYLLSLPGPNQIVTWQQHSWNILYALLKLFTSTLVKFEQHNYNFEPF